MSHEFTLWHSQALANARQDNNHDLHKALRTYAPQYRYGFEACEQHYAGRIAELEAKLTNMAALVAKKDGGLIKACELIEKLSLQVYNGSDCLKIYEAANLTADSVEVACVGRVLSDKSGVSTIGNDIRYLENGTKLYTIKVKL